jgi:hypothetical protein
MKEQDSLGQDRIKRGQLQKTFVQSDSSPSLMKILELPNQLGLCKCKEIKVNENRKGKGKCALSFYLLSFHEYGSLLITGTDLMW